LVFAIIFIGWTLAWYSAIQFGWLLFWRILAWSTQLWGQTIEPRGFLTYLGKLGDRRAIEPLLLALRDKDKSVRNSAAEALRNLGDPQAVEPLLLALNDFDILLLIHRGMWLHLMHFNWGMNSYHLLEQAAQRLAVLEGERLPARDILIE
jgi:HEAT repeat protein